VQHQSSNSKTISSVIKLKMRMERCTLNAIFAILHPSLFIYCRYKSNVDEAGTSLAGFEVLMALTMKMAVFWVVAPCRLVEVYQCFRGTHHPDDGGSKHL
jgi:hypothetical protein